MALFGKADEGIPYLTRFYQVEVPARDVVLDAKTLAGSELDRLYCAHLFEIMDHRMAQYEIEKPIEGRIPQLKELASLHRLIVPLMDALADGTRIAVRLLNEVEDYLNSVIHSRLTFFFVPTEEDVQLLRFSSFSSIDAASKVGKSTSALWEYDDDSTISAQDLHVKPVPETERSLVVEIVLEMYHFLAPQTEAAKKRLIRCTECQSPFLPHRKKQTYCSHRCADRAGARRRRLSRAVSNKTRSQYRIEYDYENTTKAV